MRFHIPFEHGAWWSFFSTLLGGALYALALGAPWAAVAALVIGLSAGFLAQDWSQALVGALLRQRSQAVSQWQAWQGWCLTGVAATATLAAVWPSPVRGQWMLFLGAVGTALFASMTVRVKQTARGRNSLPLAAVLLATPALALAALAHGFERASWAFFFWPALYYPAVTLVAQAYIRGLPKGWRYVGVVLLAGLALAALAWRAYFAGAALSVLSVLVGIELHRRWLDQPQGMPSGERIRAFGRRQAGWGVGLTVLWILEALHGPW